MKRALNRRFPLSCATLVIAMLGASQPGYSSPGMNGAYAKKEATLRKNTGLALSSLGTPQAVAFFGSLAGIDHASLEAIRADMIRRTGKAPWPKFELKNDAIFADGKATGVQYASYQPLSIKFKGKVWMYDKADTAQANYFALVDFLFPTRKATLLSLVIPEARAAGAPDQEGVPGGPGSSDSTLVGSIGGGLIGALPGVALLSAIGSSTAPIGSAILLPAVLGIGATATVAGAVGGGVFGSTFDKYENRRWVSDVVCAKKMILTQCDAGGVTIAVGSGKVNDQRRIVVGPADGKKLRPIDVYGDAGNKLMTTPYQEQRRALETLASACADGDRKFIKSWDQAANLACAKDNFGNPQKWYLTNIFDENNPEPKRKDSSGLHEEAEEGVKDAK